MSKRWYVVQAYSGYEKQVKRSIEERVILANLQDKFGDILVPTEEVVEMKGGQKRRSERKFFPGYILVEMEMEDLAWHLVRETPKVLGFIGGTADKPAPITDAEARAILNRIEDSTEKPKPANPENRIKNRFYRGRQFYSRPNLREGVVRQF